MEAAASRLLRVLDERAKKRASGRLQAPEQIQELAVPVIAHRVVLEPQARFSGLTAQGIVEEIVKRVAVPA